MELSRHSSVNAIVLEKIKQSLNFSNKGKEIIERIEDIIEIDEAYKLLEKGFDQIKKKNLYNSRIKENFKNSIYMYTDESKIEAVNKMQEFTLISKEGRNYLKKQKFTDIHMGVIIIGLLSQTREGLDTKTHLYLYDHEQAQIVVNYRQIINPRRANLYRRTHEAKALAEQLAYSMEKLVAQGLHCSIFVSANLINNKEIITSLSLLC